MYTQALHFLFIMKILLILKEVIKYNLKIWYKQKYYMYLKNKFF